MQQPLFDTRLQNPIWAHMASMLWNVWDGEGGWSWVQLSFSVWALFLVPAHCEEWRRDPAVMISRDISRDTCLPTWAYSCCLEEQHSKAIDKQRLLSCTDIWFLFLEDLPTCFLMILSPSFSLFISLFSGGGEENWMRQWVLPFLSLALCCKRRCLPLLLTWHCWAVALKIQVQPEPEEVQPLISHTAP